MTNSREELDAQEITALREKIAGWALIMEKLSLYNAPDLRKSASGFYGLAADEYRKQDFETGAKYLHEASKLIGMAELLEKIF